MAQKVMPEIKDYITWGLSLLLVIVIPLFVWYHNRIGKAIDDSRKAREEAARAVEVAESIKEDAKEMADSVSASSEKVNTRIDGLMATLMSKPR